MFSQPHYCFVTVITNDRKRQNLYYVRVQERLSTLDAEDDYIMTVTSICGPSQVRLEFLIKLPQNYYC